MYKLFYFWKIKEVDIYERPVIVVTGCSSGIGLAIAELLYRLNYFNVAITAREKSIGVLKNKFNENDHFCILPLDVGSEKNRQEVIKKILDRWSHVDILINNAGICYRSVLEEMQEKDELMQMNTNYLGPIGLIRLVLPSMRKRQKGKIINISSVSGMLAMPTMASYSASKFALEGAMEALWYETKPFGINVSLVQPGFVRSKSHERVKFSVRSLLSTSSERPYSILYKDMIPFVTRMMNFGLATPESIADLVYQVIKTDKPPLWIPASFDAEFFYYLKRWLPRRLIMPFFYFLLPGSSQWNKAKNNKKSFLTEIKDSFKNTMRIIWKF